MINLKNLQIAVDGIKAMNIPEENFDIRSFGFLNEESPEFIQKNIENNSFCNTTACFLGWFPLVKGLDPISSDFETDFLNKDILFDFNNYCERILEINPDSYLIQQRKLWGFLFDGDWFFYAPKLEHALERAQIVLDGKYDPYWTFNQYIKN